PRTRDAAEARVRRVGRKAREAAGVRISPARAKQAWRSDAHMPEINLLEAIRQAIDEMMAEDPRIFVFGEDVGKRGGVFRVTEGLYDKYGPMRVIDSPLAESVIVGAAVGAAMNETRPIAEIQFADFIAPAFNQLVQEAARIH